MTETNTDELAWSLPELPTHRCVWSACRLPIVEVDGGWMHDGGPYCGQEVSHRAMPGDPLVRMLAEQRSETEWLLARFKDARIDCGRFDRAADRVKLPKISNRLLTCAALYASGENEIREALRFDDLLARLAVR